MPVSRYPTKTATGINTNATKNSVIELTIMPTLIQFINLDYILLPFFLQAILSLPGFK